jgi:heme-degrading monooxygenase HmoA
VYVRIIRGQVDAGQVDEFAKRWQGFVPARLQAVAGFQRGYLLADRSRAGAVGSVSLWDGRPDRAALDRTMEEFRARVADLGAGPPAVEEYEVLTEVGPQ